MYYKRTLCTWLVAKFKSKTLQKNLKIESILSGILTLTCALTVSIPVTMLLF